MAADMKTCSPHLVPSWCKLWRSIQRGCHNTMSGDRQTDGIAV